jgi:hypothetical protein
LKTGKTTAVKKQLIAALAVALFLLVLLPAGSPVQSQSVPQVTVKSHYSVNRYGYALIQETVTYQNNESAAQQVPSIQMGFGNVTSLIGEYNVTGVGYTVSRGTNGNQSVFVVDGGSQSIPAGGSSSFRFYALVPGATTKFNSTTLRVLLVSEPFFNLRLKTLKLVISMPTETSFAKNPKCVCAPQGGYTFLNSGGLNYTYFQTVKFTSANYTKQQVLTQAALVKTVAGQDLHPLKVFSASRVITASASGDPMVLDSLTFQNLGTTQLTNLTVSPLTSPSSVVTVVPVGQPPLLQPTTVALNHDVISLRQTSIGLPVDPGQNYSLSFKYPLAQQYYTVSGGVVKMNMPQRPLIDTYVNSYSISISLPSGVNVVQGAPNSIGSVGPFASGQYQMSYGFSVGWALDSGVPVASIIFVVLLVGLFALRRPSSGEEEAEGEEAEEGETREETATERTTAMVKAFEEKTSLINSLFEEIPTMDPNRLNKAYFDELRSRLDTFRSRALQRLNEVKQKSTTKKFFDLLNQMHTTEREVDRAARDMLNLYEQYYTRRTRKEVFDRLLPSYRRRLDRALNQLSDELNTAQRESKLL